MLLKKIIGAIRKLIGFGKVDSAETEKQRLARLVAEGFRPGSTVPVEEVREAFFALVTADSASRGELPVRPGSENFEVIKDVADDGLPVGPDTDGTTLTILVKNTGDHVNLYMKHVSMGEWRYDFSTICLATAEGKAIRGRKGAVPSNTRSLIEAYYGNAKLENAPQKKFG